MTFHEKLQQLVNEEIANHRGRPFSALVIAEPLIDLLAQIVVLSTPISAYSAEEIVDVIQNKLDLKVIEHERKHGTYRPSQRGGEAEPVS
jgi:hypothetical protein